MALAEHGRTKAKDVKLRALAAAKARPPNHKLLSPSGSGTGAKSFNLFQLTSHSGDESGFTLFVTSKPSISILEEEDMEDEDEMEEAHSVGDGGA